MVWKDPCPTRSRSESSPSKSLHASGKVIMTEACLPASRAFFRRPEASTKARGAPGVETMPRAAGFSWCSSARSFSSSSWGGDAGGDMAEEALSGVEVGVAGGPVGAAADGQADHPAAASAAGEVDLGEEEQAAVGKRGYEAQGFYWQVG